jgi:glycosyltransferase involved in cell wall biosynthesis
MNSVAGGAREAPPPRRVVQVMCSDAFAGVERYVTTLANGLAARGMDVIVIGGEPRRMSTELSASIGAWRPARNWFEAWRALVAIGRADIVHAHVTDAEFAAVLARPVTRGALVATRHFAVPRGSTPAGAAAAIAVRRALDLQLACSAYVAARVDGRCEIVLPGVTDRDAPPAAARERVVLVLQRLAPQKDTGSALRAWACSGLGDRGWELHIVGDGPERTALERLAAELAIGASSNFLGASAEVERHLTRASILLATAPNEPFGLSVVEAMAVGLPVVASACAGHLETVGTCPEAVLVPPNDPRAAGRRLSELADDEPRRADYGRKLQALQRERFSSERQVAETLALYRGLLRASSSARRERV